MKPNFALNLTHEAIGLLHRTARGWLTIGEAALDSADLTEAIGYLRTSALGLAPQGMTTKLIIPNSQILYTEVEAPSPDPTRRMAQVRAALDGLTPYAVDELVFDVEGSGPRVKVAVIARETLDEAESFAVQHRMNPLSFVAIPPEGAFAGEPFFGPTAHAARLLAPGDRVERDAEPVNIVTREDSAARAAPPDGQTRAARRQRTAAKAQTDTPVTPPELAQDAPPAAPPELAQDAPPAAPPEHLETLPLEVPVTVAVADPTNTEAGTPAPTVAAPRLTLPDVMAAATQEPAPEPEPVVETVKESTPVAAEGGSAVESVADTSPMLAPETVALTDVALADTVAPQVEALAEDAISPTEPLAAQDGAEAEPAPTEGAPLRPPADDLPAAPAFSSRRRDHRGAPAAATQDDPMSEAGTLAPPPLSRAAPPVPSAAPPLAASALPDPDLRPVARREAPPLTVVSSAPGLAGIKAAAVGTATARGPSPATESLPPPRSVPRPALAAVPPPTAMPPSAAPAAKPPARGRATAKPAAPRGGATAVPTTRGKPRFLGLILTGLLLLVLVGFAAWSSLYLSDAGDTSAPETQVAAATPTDPAPPGTATSQPGLADSSLPEAPAPVALTTDALPGEEDPEYLADLAALGIEPDDAVADPAALQPDAEDVAPVADLPPATLPEAAPAPSAEPVAETAAPPAAPVAEVPAPAPEGATAGIAAAAPLATVTAQQDEIFLAGTDSPPPAFDPVALPPPGSAAEAPPAAALPPPPAGTLYQFDEQGRIAASDTGVVMPGGFWMIEARPPVLPPARPAPLAAAEPAPEAPAETALPAEAVADPAAAAVPTDPAIAAARPRSRPPALVAPDAAAQETQADDGAALAPPAATDVATLRPRARAGSAVALAAAARLDSGSASLVQTAAATAPPPSEMVLALSPRPAPRPASVSRAVEAAVAEAAAQPEPAAPPVEEAAAAPPPEAEAEADAEPEVATAAPRIPTRANVAKQATFANAMNLSKVNLIGIFGTPSNRYAMVRTSAGRMTRVKVGDRVDGGTVAAITASELRYQKGGQLLTLSMPRG